MSQENKMEFTTSSEDSFYDIWSDKVGHHQSDHIFFSFFMDDGNFSDGTVLCLVIMAYMRINATKATNKLHIPANASLSTLTYNEEENFFIELFNRFQIICEANAVLGHTAKILEQAFMAGADIASRAYTAGAARELLELDWSESGFSKRNCSLYVRDGLLWRNFADSNEGRAYKELHHLAPLLNVLPEHKQLCTPILYITYLANLFEQLGWDNNDCEQLANSYLNNVTAIQVDPVLWAIQTIQLVLFGCNNPLITNVDELSTIHIKIQYKVEDRFDVIFLPELRSNSNYLFTIPDVGPITIGNIIIEKKDHFYYVAFLFSLLSDKGRMLVRLNHFSPRDDNALKSEDKLLAFFVNNNLIEAMIQTESCVYMLIEKHRSETKYGKILFYYQHDFEYVQNGYPHKNERLALSLEKYSCENIKLRHDEGASIISNKEIRLNNYCLLPKEYIYDFNRVKQQVDSDMIQHIRHEANPRISNIETSLKYLGKFLKHHGLDDEPSQEKLDEDDIVPSVKEVIDGCRSDLLLLQSVFTVTREVVLESFDKSHFNLCDLNTLFADIQNQNGQKKYSIQVEGTVNLSPNIYENAFRDMIENIIRNAEVHGFTDDSRTDYRIVFRLSQKGNHVFIKCLNNGEPLPLNFSKEKLFSKGDKGAKSSGMGLGGERIGKILAAHDAGFDILPTDKLSQEFTVGFEITLTVEKGKQ